MLDDGITVLTLHDIDFERHAGRLVWVPIRELAQETQTLMLIGHDRGSSAIASVLVEMVRGMMQAGEG